jgi:hypothetical protein
MIPERPNHAMEPTPPNLNMSLYAVILPPAACRVLGGVAHLDLVRLMEHST